MKILHGISRLTLFACAAALAVANPATVLAREATATASAVVPEHLSTDRSHLLAFEGGQNFRDLGGYKTEDGGSIRWGLLYRSGSLYGITPADFAYLRKVRIQTVIDFRSTNERTLEPSPWPSDMAPQTFSEDYSLGQMSANAVNFEKLDRQKLVAGMVAMYPDILTSMNSQYRRMFDQMLSGRVPLLFHCSAGRDRTGVAGALVLTALGVPRETIIQDYLLSDRYFDIRRAGPVAKSWGGFSADTMHLMQSAARPSIEAVFKVIDSHADGSQGYLRDELGLDRTKIERLRALYVEQPGLN